MLKTLRSRVESKHACSEQRRTRCCPARPVTSPARSSTWHGQVRLGNGWAWFRGHAGDNRPHVHHALQLVLSREPQRLHGERPLQGRGLLIGSDVIHALQPSGEPVTLLYVEAESRHGRALRAALPAPVQRLDDALVDTLLDTLDGATAPDALLAQRLAGTGTLAPPSDPLIARLLETLDARLGEALTAAELATSTGLSTSRFLHRFSAHVGLPLRPYLRWRRLILALHRAVRGASLTDAALAAGFADVAHFTRTCRRHFGLAPSALTGAQAG